MFEFLKTTGGTIVMRLFYSLLHKVYRNYDCDTSVPEENMPLRDAPAVKEEPTNAAKAEKVPARWILAWLGCGGFIVLYGLKVNISVAIIAMVNHTKVDVTPPNSLLANGSTIQCGSVVLQERKNEGPFEWNENIQGLVLAAFFYGYIVTQIPGGWLSEKFSAKMVFGLGTLANIIFTILSPLCASLSYVLLAILRVGMGITAGVTLPAMHALLANWAPASERSQMASTTYAGMTLGVLLALPLTGFLASTWGWQSVFYVEGGLSLIWFALWQYFAYDSPQVHPRISSQEKQYLEETLPKTTRDSNCLDERVDVTPWRQIWTSPAVWAIIIAHTCANWGWYMVVVKFPAYMHHILHFNLKANATLSAVPYICQWLFAMGFGAMNDKIINQKLVTLQFARKFATFFGMFGSGLCLVCVTLVGCDYSLAVFLLSVATMMYGSTFSGFLANHIDIAPQYAGTLMGITNTFATIPGIVMPSLVGYLTNGNQTIETWREIFLINFAIQCIGALLFCWLGSGERQWWAQKDEQEETKQLQEDE